MAEFEKAAFLELVGEQIRSKRAHSFVLRELEDHIDDQTAANVSAGLSKAQAEQEAVRSMGDPVLVGQQLDRIHRPKPAWSVLLVTVLLIAAGIIINWLLFSVDSKRVSPNMFFQYILSLLLGVGAMAVVYFVDYSLLARYPKSSLLLLLAVCWAGFLFPPLYGAYFYVSPPAALFVPLYGVFIFLLRGRGVRGVLLCGGIYALASMPVLLAPNLSKLLSITICCLILLTVSICKGWFGRRRTAQLLTVYGPLFCIMVAVSCTEIGAALMRRITYMLHPEQDPMGAGYAVMTVRRLLSGAQLFGPAKAGFDFAAQPLEAILPGWYHGYMITYLIAKYGWITFIVIAMLFFVFLFFLFYACFQIKNKLGAVLAFSSTLVFTLDCVFNLLGNLGINFLFAPPPLLILSHGGYDMIINFLVLGLFLSAYRGQDITAEPGEQKNGSPAKWRPTLCYAKGRLTVDFDPHGFVKALPAVRRKTARSPHKM